MSHIVLLRFEVGRELTRSYYHGMEGPNSTRDELDGFGTSFFVICNHMNRHADTRVDMRKSTPRDTVSCYSVRRRS